MKKRQLLLFIVCAVFAGTASVAVAAAPEITRSFSVGSTDAVTGGEVSLWQKFLIEEGYLKIQKPTGFFLRLTAKATEEWQKNKGISPTASAVGPKTRAKLRELKMQALEGTESESANLPIAEPELLPAVPASEIAPVAEPISAPECFDRRVPSNYNSIKDAITAACDGDAIVLAEGTYEETVAGFSRPLTVKSETSPEKTVIRPRLGPAVQINPGETLTLSGLTLIGSGSWPAVYVTGAASLPVSLTIERSIIRDSEFGIIIQGAKEAGGIILLKRNLLADNRLQAISDSFSGDVLAENNTIVKNGTGYYLNITRGGHELRNNLIVANSDGGVALSSGTDEVVLKMYYNNNWGNGGNDYYSYRNVRTFTPEGRGNMQIDPRFTADYHLNKGSPAIDAGDPSSPSDPDGTRADIGAYPFNQTAKSAARRGGFLAALAGILFGWIR